MQVHIFKASLMLFLIFISCKQRDIGIEVVRRSSDLMNCTKVFGYSAKKIEEENEILIQTGIYYGDGEEEDRPAAMVNVNHAQKVLYLTAQQTVSGENTEVYKDDSYSLSLKYVEKKKGDRIYYDGRCRIKKGLIISEYKIEGEPNIHNY